jgi:hypothetical protein
MIRILDRPSTHAEWESAEFSIAISNFESLDGIVVTPLQLKKLKEKLVFDALLYLSTGPPDDVVEHNHDLVLLFVAVLAFAAGALCYSTQI